MCDGKGCSLKNKCYRFRAAPSEYMQAYFVRPPNITGTKCEHFCDVEGWWVPPLPEELAPVPRRKMNAVELETPKEYARKKAAKNLSCDICPPHRGENAGRKPKRGAQKPKSKNKGKK